MSKPKTDRNIEIYKKHKKGISTYKLALEYQITQPAIFKIIKREERNLQNAQII